jgi:hypothetical protein
VAGHIAGHDIYDEVMPSLVELAEARQQTARLLRGRTFARAAS